MCKGRERARAVRRDSIRNSVSTHQRPVVLDLKTLREEARNKYTDSAPRDGKCRCTKVTWAEYTQPGDAAHVAPVSQGNLVVVVYRVMPQQVRECYLLRPRKQSRLIGRKQYQPTTTDVRRWLLWETPRERQTGGNTGTQSHEAKAHCTALRQSSRRTVYWRCTDAPDATARPRRRLFLRLQWR